MRTLGFLVQGKLARWYGADDLDLLPSCCESWDLTINEPMAAGRSKFLFDILGCFLGLVPRDVTCVRGRGDIGKCARATAKESQQDAMTQCRSSAEYRIATRACGIQMTVAIATMGL